jgi:hypothetical protein
MGSPLNFFKKLSNITSHINRFGKYSIDKTIKIPELIFDIELKKSGEFEKILYY